MKKPVNFREFLKHVYVKKDGSLTKASKIFTEDGCKRIEEYLSKTKRDESKRNNPISSRMPTRS